MIDPSIILGAQIRDDLEDLIERGRDVWADRKVTVPEAMGFLAEFYLKLEATLRTAKADPEISREIIATAFATAFVQWLEPIDLLPRMPEWLERKFIDAKAKKWAYQAAFDLLENFEQARK